MHSSRNDPCPCGSGNKYKKCCGRVSRTAMVPEVSRANAAKALDRTLTERIMRFAQMRLGREWLQSAIDAYTGDEGGTVDDTELQLAIPWAMFHCPLPGREVSLAHLFGEEKAARLSQELRDVLVAQLHAWLTVWEVRRVERGVGVSVADLLTGEERFVHEISASSFMGARDALLGCVVDSGGISFFGGIHPQPLEPRDADLVVREVRKLCRVRTRPVKVERLRDPNVQLALIDIWRSFAARLREPRPKPKLANTDGDPLVFTTDHFEILTPEVSALLARLASFAGAEAPEEGEAKGGDDGTVITITKPGNASMKYWDNTIVGRVVIAGTRMRVESNSTRRADALRSSLTSHLGELVRHRLRDETSQEEMFRRAEEIPRQGNGEEQPAQTPELTAIAREFKEQHMVAWLDQKLPALGGQTPREAAQSPRSRASLELLLREFENHESRLPEEERLDIDLLRAALGMPG